LHGATVQRCRLKDLLDEGLVRAAGFRVDKAVEREKRGQVSPALTAEEEKLANEAIAYSCIKCVQYGWNSRSALLSSGIM
jgi:hypothetical protein